MAEGAGIGAEDASGIEGDTLGPMDVEAQQQIDAAALHLNHPGQPFR